MVTMFQRALVSFLLALLATASPAAGQGDVQQTGQPSQCELGPVDDLAAPAGTVRLVVLGDFGDPGPDGGASLSEAAQRVLEAIEQRHRERPYQFGLTVGDNFYPAGVATLEALRQRWQPYEALGLRFYATLGNHDYMWGRARNQVRYTASPLNVMARWQMPCRYYSFSAGPVAFVALDTDEGTLGWWRRLRRAVTGRFREVGWSAAQTTWVEAQLVAAADAPWRIVYGHHPVRSVGRHGDSRRLSKGTPSLSDLLERHRVISVAGHDHSLQFLRTPDTLYFVSGGGGRGLTDAGCEGDPSCVYASRESGFLEIEAAAAELRWAFIGAGEREADGTVPVSVLCSGTATRPAGGGFETTCDCCAGAARAMRK
jgi:tartrate-resistant acid phosphatase type 5